MGQISYNTSNLRYFAESRRFLTVGQIPQTPFLKYSQIWSIGSQSKGNMSLPFNARFRSFDPGGPRGLPRLLSPPLSTTVPSDRVEQVQYRGMPKKIPLRVLIF